MLVLSQFDSVHTHCSILLLTTLIPIMLAMHGHISAIENDHYSKDHLRHYNILCPQLST